MFETCKMQRKEEREININVLKKSCIMQKVGVGIQTMVQPN